MTATEPTTFRNRRTGLQVEAFVLAVAPIAASTCWLVVQDLPLNDSDGSTILATFGDRTEPAAVTVWISSSDWEAITRCPRCGAETPGAPPSANLCAPCDATPRNEPAA
jgi:hypothetical protein